MKKYILSLILIVAVVSCVDDDYKLDGGTSSPYVNMSTYDFLASNHLFDTLVMAIDKAGLKDVVNSDVTFFVTTHFSFRKYIDVMTVRGRAKYNEPNYKYQFDSIPVDVLHDSLSMYIYPGKIERHNMSKEGEVLTNAIGTQLRISLEPGDDYTGDGKPLVEKPEFVFLTYKRGNYWDEWDAKNLPATEIDTKDRIQTSGLISTTGIIHVLPNQHTLFFTKN
ncbi:hypothetical protein [Prevotella sp. 10(H)]|uniref:hypothetical protein n=1 Tax=Prevotella sp. 10(H) TaxID=1158294 RepID=UPI0004A6B1F1|nr:hypothetical protein [Prevotella sp. 10(H)]